MNHIRYVEARRAEGTKPQRLCQASLSESPDLVDVIFGDAQLGNRASCSLPSPRLLFYSYLYVMGCLDLCPSPVQPST